MMFFHVWIRLLGFGIQFLLFFLLLRDLWQSEDKQPDLQFFFGARMAMDCDQNWTDTSTLCPSVSGIIVQVLEHPCRGLPKVFTFVPIAPLG